MAKVNFDRINKTQAWVLWSIGIVIICVLFSMAIKPKIKMLEEIKADISKEKKKISMAKELISKREEYEKEIQTIKQKIKYYEEKLPQEKETDQLLEELARIATEAKIKYQFIKPGPMVSLRSKNIDLPYYRWPITMRLTCGYHELGHYINQLENAKRFIKIDDLSIDASQDVFQHQVTLNLSTYVAGK